MPQNQADIFISYAHLDNTGSMDEVDNPKEGWVSKFHQHLEPRLKTILGSKDVKIWRDNELRGNDDFSEKIHNELSKNKLLICIYSPSYLASSWCGREVDFFRSENSSSTGTKIGSKSKIFKVLKMKIDRNKEPELMQKELGYRFYGKKGTEYNFSIHGEQRSAYASQLEDLAFDIAEVLKLMQKGEKEVSKTSNLKKVFVAETPDCVREREVVRRELQILGYEVLPSQYIMGDTLDAYQNEVMPMIQAADFYVQLMGEEYGQRFSDSESSRVKVQHELIFEAGKKENRNVFNWIKKDSEWGRSMREFVKDFHKRVDQMPMEEGDRILLLDGTPIERLNLEISQLIKEKELITKPKKQEVQTREIKKILLLISEADRQKKNFVSLYKYLVSIGAEVKISTLDLSTEKAEEDFKYQATSSSAIVIFYGEGDELWLSGQQKLVEKHAIKGAAPIAIYTFEPVTLEKEIMDSSFYEIINGMNQLEPDKNIPLAEFLKKSLEQ